jgi:exodeoxyribonuclease-5
LPPVKGAGYFIDAEPDAMLTEVHRQAYGNPVTYLATVVRESGIWGLLPGKFGESRITRQPLADTLETFLAADQVLCGRNATRRTLNAMIRAAKGYDPEPMPTPGEKIICLRNNRKLGLLNGSMWNVVSCWRNGDYFEADIEPWDEADRSDDSVQRVVMHTDYFAGGEPMPEDKFDAHEFDWGYAITVHKAQGSQWPRVAIVNDSWLGEDRFQDHWMYTAITRAQESVHIIKPRRK